MTLDVPIVVAFIYLFVTLNFFGWGMFHDQRFIFFSLAISFLYLASSVISHAKRMFILWRVVLLYAFIGFAVFGITINLMQLRNTTSVEGFINDSGLQTEIAGRFLLLGKNPYRETYEQTDLAKAKYIDEAGSTVNPALFHNAYPPFFLILSAVGFRIFSQAFHWFDIRIISLFFYGALLILGIVKFRLNERLILFLALIGINPMFLSLMIQGSNDVVVVTMLLWSLFLLEKKRWIIAGILLGIAIGTKQLAWIAAPFYCWYVWRIHPKKFLSFVGMTMIPVLVIFVPFIVWDAAALWEDLVLYINGSIPTSYPIHNFGLGMFLVKQWMIPSIYAYYPFWIWQVVIGGIVLFFWLRHIRRKKTFVAGDVLTGLVLLLSVSWIFNRFMNFSYLAAIAGLAGAAAIWYDLKKEI